MEAFAKVCSDFGLVGGLLLIIIAGALTMCGFGFKWILEQFKVELEGNRKERTEYLGILHKISMTIDEHDKRADERGRYVREEHKEMLNVAKETLVIAGRINGYKQ